MDCVSNIYQKWLEKNFFSYIFIFIFYYFFFQSNLISKTICISVYFQNVYLFVVAIYISFLRQLYFFIFFFNFLDKRRIYPETFEFQINVFRWFFFFFYKIIIFILILKTIINFFQYIVILIFTSSRRHSHWFLPKNQQQQDWLITLTLVSATL